MEGVIVKRILGKLSKDIAEQHGLYEHINKKIVLYDNDRKHCEKKHMHEFKDKKTFHYVMDNLEYIIEKPDRVFYVKGYDVIENKATGEKTKVERYSLEYYKELDEDVTVRVRVDEGRELKVKTVFKVDKEKIERKIEKDIYGRYVMTEEEFKNRNNKITSKC